MPLSHSPEARLKEAWPDRDVGECLCDVGPWSSLRSCQGLAVEVHLGYKGIQPYSRWKVKACGTSWTYILLQQPQQPCHGARAPLCSEEFHVTPRLTSPHLGKEATETYLPAFLEEASLQPAVGRLWPKRLTAAPLTLQNGMTPGRAQISRPVGRTRIIRIVC